MCATKSILYTGRKRQRPILGHGRARRTVAGARPHTEASSVGPRDRAALLGRKRAGDSSETGVTPTSQDFARKRKARASTSVPYRIKDTE